MKKIFRIYCAAVLALLSFNGRATGDTRTKFLSIPTDKNTWKDRDSSPLPLQPSKEQFGEKKKSAGEKNKMAAAKKKGSSSKLVKSSRNKKNKMAAAKKKGSSSKLVKSSRNKKSRMVAAKKKGSSSKLVKSSSDKKSRVVAAKKENSSLKPPALSIALKEKGKAILVRTGVAQPPPLFSKGSGRATVEQKILPSAPTKTALPPDPTLSKGLENLGNTCYANGAIQLFNAVKPFRKSITESPSTNPLILGLREIFRGINSAEGIQRNRLEELLNDKIFPPLNARKGEGRFTKTGQGDASELIEVCFTVLEENKEQATQCFKFEGRSILQDKNDPTNRRENYHSPENTLSLFISQTPEGQEIPGEFMQAFRKFGDPEEIKDVTINSKKVDGIRREQIVNPPQVFLIKIARMGWSEEKLTKNDRPLAIPLEFTLPPGIMVEPKSIKYKLIGGIVHLGTANGGHYIAYIRTPGGFFEFDDAHVRRVSEEEGQRALKRAYVLAYERED